MEPWLWYLRWLGVALLAFAVAIVAVAWWQARRRIRVEEWTIDARSVEAGNVIPPTKRAVHFGHVRIAPALGSIHWDGNLTDDRVEVGEESHLFVSGQLACKNVDAELHIEKGLQPLKDLDFTRTIEAPCTARGEVTTRTWLPD